MFIPDASLLPVETIVILSTLASGLARARNFRHPGKQLVDDRSLVVLLVGLGFHVHGFGLGLAFLEDDLGFGFALSANRRRMTIRFRHQALLFRERQRFNSLALDFGALQHGCDQLFLAAVDFGFLNLDLLFFFDLLYLHLLGDDLLLHDVGLDVIGFVGLGLLALGDFDVLCFLDFEVAGCFRLLGHGKR
ncbi:MAG: hypothetical protein ACRD3H_01995, partial [Terriglobales bacterium]